MKPDDDNMTPSPADVQAARDRLRKQMCALARQQLLDYDLTPGTIDGRMRRFELDLQRAVDDLLPLDLLL